MAQVQLKSETIASQGFFSPIRLDFPLILTRQERLMEIYKLNDSLEIQKIIQYSEGNTIYEYLWTDTGKFIVLVKDHPIVLRSVETGNIIQKYSIYSHLDEIKSPYTACIENHQIYTILGNIIYEIDIDSGSKKEIRIKSDKLRPRTITNLIAINKSIITIGSYDEIVYFVDKNSQKIINKIEALKGVTQLMYKEQNLYIGARHSNCIQIWDLRLMKNPKHIINLPRLHQSYQKILFDIDFASNLAVGNTDGSIFLYNHNFELTSQVFAHFDAVNSVQFFSKGIVTSSGQRWIDSKPISLIREFWWNN